MPLESGNRRKLLFPLFYSENPLQLGGDTEDSESLTPQWLDIPNDEKTLIGLYLSLDEFIAIASALDVGRDIAYGDESIELWYVWTKALRMDICQIIADCLNNPNSPAYSALLAQIGNYVDEKLPVVGKTGNPETPEINTQNPLVIEPQGACSEENLFGAIVGLLEFANSTITDVFEKLEVATNSSEQLSIVLGAIPIFNTLPYDDMLIFANQLQEALAENYNGAYTTVLRDTMACELFCLYKDTCQINFQDLADYFGNKVSLEIGTFSFEEGIAWLASYSSLGDDVVYASHFLLFQIIAYGATFANVDSGYLIRMAQALWNDPNPDYAVLCTECPGSWMKTFDFTAGNGGWTPRVSAPYGANNQAVYVAGVGWRNATLSGNAVMTIDRDFSSSTLTKMVVRYSMSVSSLNIREAGLRTTTGTYVLVFPLANTAGTHQTSSAESVYLAINRATVSLHKAGTNGQVITVTGVDLYGEGAYPF